MTDQTTARAVALLRSINVGGNRMKMDWLRDFAERHGCQDVRTLLASGNLVMAHPGDLEPTRLRLEAALADEYGDLDIVMRDAQGLAQAVADNPWRAELESGELEGKEVHTLFLLDRIAPSIAHGVEPAECVDEFAVVGNHVFIRFVDGSYGSPYTGTWFERRLDTVGTMRNHNTVVKVLDAVDQQDG